jgi:hypothetical protein
VTVYATAAELETWTGATAPADAARQLTRASELIDQALMTASYATDSSGDAVDVEVVSALRDATCAQVEFWMASDEQDDVLGPTQGIAVGGLQEQYGAGDNRITPTHLAPRAWRVLRGCAWIFW